MRDSPGRAAVAVAALAGAAWLIAWSRVAAYVAGLLFRRTFGVLPYWAVAAVAMFLAGYLGLVLSARIPRLSDQGLRRRIAYWALVLFVIVVSSWIALGMARRGTLTANTGVLVIVIVEAIAYAAFALLGTWVATLRRDALPANS